MAQSKPPLGCFNVHQAIYCKVLQAALNTDEHESVSCSNNIPPTKLCVPDTDEFSRCLVCPSSAFDWSHFTIPRITPETLFNRDFTC